MIIVIKKEYQVRKSVHVYLTSLYKLPGQKDMIFAGIRGRINSYGNTMIFQGIKYRPF